MEVRIIVETVFENGEMLTHDVGRICRPLDDAGTESLGLHLVEAKELLKRLQETVLRDQIDELLRATRNCSACGKRRAIHDDRGRSLGVVCGRVWNPTLARSSRSCRARRRCQKSPLYRMPSRSILHEQKIQPVIDGPNRPLTMPSQCCGAARHCGWCG